MEARYKAVWRTKRSREETEGNPTTLGGALHDGEAAMPTSKVVMILKEDTGQFCSENKGNWSLHQILK